MISIISNLCESVPQFVIVGDFNLTKIDWVNYASPNEKCHNLFLTLVNSLGMHQYVLEPTRENNILDLVLSNIISLLSNISVECPFSTSDHNSVLFHINTFNYYQPETNSKSFYIFNNTDVIGFISHLSKINWDFDFSFVFTTEDYWNIFSDHLRKGIDRFVTIRTLYHKKKSRSYPKYIYKMLIRKSFLWKRWSITKTILHKKAFIQYASKYKKAISNINVELKLVKENNSNKFFNYVNKNLNNLKKIYPLKTNSNFTTSNVEIAEVFNKHLGSVFTVDDRNLPKINTFVSEHVKIDCIDFSEKIVHQKLKNLKPNTSFRPDGILNILLK
ncbi:uncharacterized protein LOC136076089 [Hydra vulgaris]|uniref:Uncharacterized protein LOC136076089 n=1 Tax=Hydra vulgaris TaxID=6087 RepID=A0ABM4B9P0_HYDVU